MSLVNAKLDVDSKGRGSIGGAIGRECRKKRSGRGGKSKEAILNVNKIL